MEGEYPCRPRRPRRTVAVLATEPDGSEDMHRTLLAILFAGLVSVPHPARAAATYWNLFNFEGESVQNSVYATYATAQDMFLDQNRTGFYSPTLPFFDKNIVGSGSDGKTYWNLFNFEGESAENSVFATYATVQDMLLDQNRTGFYSPTNPFFDRNIVDAESDGKIYWNLFNFEGEAVETPVYATYATAQDMFLDQNRTGFYTPTNPFFDRNIIGSGSDGKTYWNVFNFEGESVETAVYATYATAQDMFLDQNRTGFYTPTNPFFDRNIIGAGSDGFVDVQVGIPEPASWLLMLMGFGAIGASVRASGRRNLRAAATC
jgi:hypothetical protein